MGLRNNKLPDYYTVSTQCDQFRFFITAGRSSWLMSPATTAILAGS